MDIETRTRWKEKARYTCSFIFFYRTLRCSRSSSLHHNFLMCAVFSSPLSPNPGSEEEAARGACRPTRPDAVHGPHLRGAHRTVPMSSPDTCACFFAGDDEPRHPSGSRMEARGYDHFLMGRGLTLILPTSNSAFALIAFVLSCVCVCVRLGMSKRWR